MLMTKDTKNKDKLLEEAEREELMDFCQSRNFTKEETERFVKLSMERFKKNSIPSDI